MTESVTGSVRGAEPPAGEFVRVCRLDELPVEEAACAVIYGVRVAIVRTSEHEVHAVNDTCSHANVSLSEGDVDGCTIECWLHGSRFDLISGKPTGLPATQPISVYPVRIENDEVFVSIAPANTVSNSEASPGARPAPERQAVPGPAESP